MNTYRMMFMLILIGIILILVFLIVDVYRIEYHRLSLSVSYGKAQYLLPSTINLISIVLLLIMGVLLLVCRYLGGILFNVILLLVSSMMMFAIISFLLQGYVTGDQPRAEFALGSMIVEGRLSLEDAEFLSGYFHWPGLWMYEGVFSAITDISSFEAPVFLMVVTWFMLGLALTIMARYVHDGMHFSMAITAFLFYSIFNPYKIIHLCPQIYALLLLIMVAILLFRNLALSNCIVILILAIAIIVSHPLTSIILVGILLFVSLKNSITKFFERIPRMMFLSKGFALSILLLFIVWNVRFEDIIREIVLELTGDAQLQLLEPAARLNLYYIDPFYKTMASFRYMNIFLMLLLALLTILLRRDNRKIKEVFSLIIALSISSLLLNFVPGTFFHRVLYYLTPFIAVLSVGSLSALQKLINATLSKTLVRIVSAFTIILVPLLAQLSIMEFLTNNNPLSTLNSPYEFSLCEFVSNFYVHSDYSWSVSSGAILYYTVLSQERILRPYTLSSTNVLQATHLAMYLKEENSSAVRLYVEIVYPAHFFVVSPRERYVFYERTLFEDFHVVDYYISKENNKLYDNKLFQLYRTPK